MHSKHTITFNYLLVTMAQIHVLKTKEIFFICKCIRMQLKRDSEINCTLNRQYLQVKSENNTEKKTVHCHSNIEDFSRNV